MLVFFFCSVNTCRLLLVFKARCCQLFASFHCRLPSKNNARFAATSRRRPRSKGVQNVFPQSRCCHILISATDSSAYTRVPKVLMPQRSLSPLIFYLGVSPASFLSMTLCVRMPVFCLRGHIGVCLKTPGAFLCVFQVNVVFCRCQFKEISVASLVGTQS